MNTRIAKNILAHICYASLATTSQSGLPWCSPVYVAFDRNHHFYWISARQAHHSQNIREHRQIAAVLYDSTVSEGTGKGVYIQAIAQELSDPDEIASGLLAVFGRAGEQPPAIEIVRGNSPLRIYKAEMQAAWINVGGQVNGTPIEQRVEINLNNL
ncbi:pyridoxamine 5'-phosphate oxidase family protein [Ktedonosporobacter rubrisoli]|uniref:Pyridoxamine 5'-phosphate oxidase family protein n=1 Tax=Ktedonosporobacter rubrisoli TaxID=2509675 RepID=A0A4P6JPH0_KTERU|nr:pyridoxamine 5'-phosphate oxidase family protein [Ktedonosporobacter rubrisoli]QBD77278.1 pyridoxamine 5'-phosphate oxidase family protein [Ktedonosporobacter rubrisoli]